MNSYADIYDDSEPLPGLDVKASALPASVVSALAAVQSLDYATLIIYDEDAKSFRFAAISTAESDHE